MAKQSLAAQSGALAAAPKLQMPAIFGQPAEDIKGRTFGPYVTFAHNKRTDEFKKIIAAIQRAPDEHDMYLMEPDRVTPLPTMKCHWIAGFQRWLLTDESGQNVLDVSSVEKPKPFKEQIEAVLLVYVGDRLVPANVQFRTTKCPAGKVMFEAAKEVMTPEWAAKSEAHKLTLSLDPPYRFYGVVTVQPPRNPKGGGLPYRPTACDIMPTGANEVAVLSKAGQDVEGFQELLSQAAERYSFRKQQLDQIIAKNKK